MSTSSSIDSVLVENRSFPPPAAVSASSYVKTMADYERMAARAAEDPDGFWSEIAGTLEWKQKWSRVLDWKLPDAKWFVGGTLNASVSCLDRHAHGARKNKAAILWEGEPGDTRVITYGQLHREVCKAANALTALGVKPATSSRSTCRWFQRPRSRCSRARASVRRTPWCSAGSRRRRSQIGSTTRRPSS